MRAYFPETSYFSFIQETNNILTIVNTVSAILPTTGSNIIKNVEQTIPAISIAVPKYFIYIYLIGY